MKGRPSAVLPVAEAESQQPGNVSLNFENRRGRGPLLLQPRHLGLEPANLGAEGVGRRRLGTALARHQALQRPPAAGGPCAHRQMRAVPPVAAQQAADLAQLATAIRLLDDPQSILGRAPAPDRLGENLRVRSTPSRRGFGPGGRTPRAGVARGYTSLRTFGSAFIRVPLCRPLIPWVVGVSAMLAERAAAGGIVRARAGERCDADAGAGGEGALRRERWTEDVPALRFRARRDEERPRSDLRPTLAQDAATGAAANRGSRPEAEFGHGFGLGGPGPTAASTPHAGPSLAESAGRALPPRRGGGLRGRGRAPTRPSPEDQFLLVGSLH